MVGKKVWEREHEHNVYDWASIEFVWHVSWKNRTKNQFVVDHEMQLSGEWALASCVFFFLLQKTWKHFGLHSEWMYKNIFGLYTLGLHFMVFTRNLRSVLFSSNVCSFVRFLFLFFAHLSNFKAKHLKRSLSNGAIECLGVVFCFRICCIFPLLLAFAVSLYKRCLLFDILA